MFGYAWRLLSAAEQQALARLSVFRGSLNRAAAQVVAEVRASTLVFRYGQPPVCDGLP
jgi:hypothetical protein